MDRQSLRLPVDGCGGAGREFRKTSNAADVQSCVSSSQNDAPNPIEQRKWAFIPNVDKVDNARYLVSKQMTNLLRHQPELRELDGAVALENLLTHSSQAYQAAGTRNNGLIA